MLQKYLGGRTTFTDSLLHDLEIDIQFLNDPYNPEVNYAGRGDSRKWNLTEFLIPEFGYNEIFYIHDKMYELVAKKIGHWTKLLADRLMYQLLKLEGFLLAFPYYLAVRIAG